jgi:MerR family transcriptional regulator, light-induced transcriptional regulator
LTDIYIEIFQESLYEIGQLWERNQITLAQEHMATIVQWSIAQLYPFVEPPATLRGHAIITGVQRENHQVGANLVADALEASGWAMRFLGTNLPQESILQVMEEHRAELLGIWLTMLIRVPYGRDLIGKVKERFGKDAAGSSSVALFGMLPTWQPICQRKEAPSIFGLRSNCSIKAQCRISKRQCV